MEPLPTLPDGYESVRVLGVGTQGSTVLAKEAKSGSLYAIKVFTLGQSADWKAFERFERECKVLRSLDHPGIPTFVTMEPDVDAGRYFLVMQYVEGQSLETAMAEAHRYTDQELRRLVDQLLDILEYLHDLNPPVFHRDIKPANVMRDAAGHVWLVDFGGVREAFRGKGNATVVGTFGYMAPEQMRGEAGPGTDLYGLGTTIAAVASGVDATELPTRGLTLDLTKTMKPGALRDAVEAMVEPDPRDRAGSVARVRTLLRAQPSDPAPRPLPARQTATAALAKSPASQSWVHGPLFLSRQFMGGIAMLSSLVTVGVGNLFVFPFAFVVFTMFGVPIMKGVRRAYESDD